MVWRLSHRDLLGTRFENSSLVARGDVDFFRVLGSAAWLGALWAAGPRGGKVVLSYRLWQSAFDSIAGIVNRPLRWTESPSG
jgi:hypothetical protein